MVLTEYLAARSKHERSNFNFIIKTTNSSFKVIDVTVLPSLMGKLYHHATNCLKDWWYYCCVPFELITWQIFSNLKSYFCRPLFSSFAYRLRGSNSKIVFSFIFHNTKIYFSHIIRQVILSKKKVVWMCSHNSYEHQIHPKREIGRFL